MSVAEPVLSPVKQLQPLQKWYMLFPANWAQLAFDLEWRTNRFKALDGNQFRVCMAFCGCFGLTGFLLLLNLFAGHGNSTSPSDLRSQIISLSLFASSVFMLVGLLLNYMKSELERILLQIIDRLEQHL